jgi:hypothetical protein
MLDSSSHISQRAGSSGCSGVGDLRPYGPRLAARRIERD